MNTVTMAPTDNKISSDFPFESHYLEVHGSQIHYIDEGEGDPIVFLHGNPTSSYLWRNIIPYLTPHTRCIAPDLIGMGRSDKPDLAYGYLDSYAYLEGFLKKMNLENVTLVIHDWGSGLGFNYAFNHQDQIKGIAFMEALYKPGDLSLMPKRIQTFMKLIRSRFGNWMMAGVMNLFVKKMIPNGVVRELSKAELEAYARPFPTLKSRKPVRRWPQEIPFEGKPAAIHRIVTNYAEWLKSTNLPMVCFYADPGMMIQARDVEYIRTHFQNTRLVPIGKGLHFVQEDQPHNIGRELAKWFTDLK